MNLALYLGVLVPSWLSSLEVGKNASSSILLLLLGVMKGVEKSFEVFQTVLSFS